MKSRYRAATLILCVLLLIGSIWVLTGPSRNRSKSSLCGTWRLPSGSLVTLNADGTAVDHSRDNSKYGYRWSISENVLKFERIRSEQNLVQAVGSTVERLAGNADYENYRIVSIESGVLTLEYEAKNQTFLWIRETERDALAQD